MHCWVVRREWLRYSPDVIEWKGSSCCFLCLHYFLLSVERPQGKLCGVFLGQTEPWCPSCIFSVEGVASTGTLHVPAPPFQSLEVFSQLPSLVQHYMQLDVHVELRMYCHTHSKSELQFELQTKLGHFLQKVTVPKAFCLEFKCSVYKLWKEHFP